MKTRNLLRLSPLLVYVQDPQLKVVFNFQSLISDIYNYQHVVENHMMQQIDDCFCNCGGLFLDSLGLPRNSYFHCHIIFCPLYQRLHRLITSPLLHFSRVTSLQPSTNTFIIIHQTNFSFKNSCCTNNSTD